MAAGPNAVGRVPAENKNRLALKEGSDEDGQVTVGRHEVGKHAGHSGTQVEGLNGNRGFLRREADVRKAVPRASPESSYRSTI